MTKYMTVAGLIVLLVTIPGLAVTVVPAVTILAFMLLFYVMELLLWVPLKLSFLVRAAITKREPERQVNVPHFRLKL